MKLLEWTREHPELDGPYYFTTLWGKVLFTHVVPPLRRKDPRVWWYGPISVNNEEIWSPERPTRQGYYYQSFRHPTNGRWSLGEEYLDVVNGHLCRFDLDSQMPIILANDPVLPGLFWHGPIPRPPVECRITL